jgi:hypothetical protein
MGFIVGTILAPAVGPMAKVVGLDRDRAFYPSVLMVVASFYALFAVMGGSLQALALESVAIVAFIAAAIAGFRGSPWLVVAGLAAHGAHDLVHGRLVANPGVPAWWPAFCSAYDVVAAAGKRRARRTARGRSRAPATPR